MSDCTSQTDTLNLELDSDPRVLPGLRRTLRHWAARHGWSNAQAGEITLAVDEAISNVIRHGYGCETANCIHVTVLPIQAADGEGGVEIRVRDYGKQVDPGEIRGRDLDDVRPGGLGVHIIRAMMTLAEYTRAEGGGMLLVMRKYKSHTVGGDHLSGPGA